MRKFMFNNFEDDVFDDLDELLEEEEPLKIPRSNRYHRWLIGRRKLRNLYRKTRHKYGVGAYFDYYKHRIIKDSVNSKSIRQECNRRFRRRMNQYRYDTVANGAAYRKHEDYWWGVI